MFFVDQLIFYSSLLVLLGILSRKFSSKFGVPTLVLFMILGMLAGSEGIGGIVFENYQIAHGIATIALVVILFDGGLRTPMESIRVSWRPAFILATAGVLITAAITGVAAGWILGFGPLEGLLLGGIVASTDAAAVFSILRTKGVRLNDRLKATLEIESGSNDPMAIFLTIGFIEVILGERSLGVGLVSLFVTQIGLGCLFGLILGRVAAFVVNKINLDAAGLYPVLVLALGLATYGLTVVVGGSGYLAVYVAGIVLGNSSIVFQRGTFLFHDGLAWISQIVMFVVLGLLSTPSELIEIAWGGLAVAAVLMFVSRPVAVFLLVWGFRFTINELLLISWVGLKGAVPIILATFPLMFGVPDGFVYFNVIFFVVLISALTQGWSLPIVARWLGLELPEESESPVTLDITSLRHVEADIVDYTVTERSAAAHMRISELELPEDVVIAMVSRGDKIIPARGPTVLLPGDHVFAILRPAERELVDRVFRTLPQEQEEVPLRTGILLPGRLSLREVDILYGISLNGDANESLEDWLHRHLNRPLDEGSFLEDAGVRFYVHSIGKEGGPVIGIEELS